MISKDIGKTENELKLLVNEEVNNLRHIIAEKENQIDNYRKEHGVLETFFREVKDHIKPIESVELFYRPPRSQKKVTNPCTAVIHITDLHMGAVQLAEEIEGFGEYSPEICRKRSMYFIKQAVEWVNLHRNSYKVDECVVIVTGDMISGDIHEELKVTNAFPAPIQCVEASVLLSDQIALLSPHFSKVRVEFIVEDNHGRLTKKPQAKEAGLNSFNYIVGFIAKERTSKLNNVEFNVYPMYEKVIQVNNSRYLITHGHNIRGWMGIPYYSIERKVAKEATKRMNGPLSTKFDKIIMGHWHVPMTSSYYWIGGSVQGTDAYDHQNGRHGIPSQSSWLVHPVHKEFDRTDFNLG